MKPDIVIRPYETRDRAAVREICCDTADRGEPVERFLSERELVAELVTRYYTDFNSEACWVAEQNGRVVGYLTGCLDSARWWQAMWWRIAPLAVLRAIAGGALARAQTWRYLRGQLRCGRRSGLTRRALFAQYPSHLHLNILHEFRGANLGTRLLDEFIKRAHAAGVAGVHANVSRDNAGARRFFERAGFVLISDPLHSTVVYGLRLA